MASERAQASATAKPAPTATGVDPSPAAAGVEASSPATAGSATTGATGDQGGNLPELTEEVLRNHPAVRDYVLRAAQSRADRLINQERQRWEREQQARAEAVQQRKQIEEELAADEYELGKKRKEELQRQITVEPYREQFLQEGHKQGYVAAYGELAAALEQNPLWKGLPETERAELIAAHGSLPNLITAVVGRQARQEAETLAEQKAQARLEKELAKFKTAAARDQRAEARASEPNPDVGSGTPVAGTLTQEEWDRNRGNRAWKIANLNRLQAAVAAGRVRR